MDSLVFLNAEVVHGALQTATVSQTADFLQVLRTASQY